MKMSDISWFTDEGFVDHAESVVRSGRRGGVLFNDLTTTQIRGLLSMTAALYDKANSGNRPADRDLADLRGDLANLRIQFIYQAGRNGSVRDFVEKSQVLDVLKAIDDRPSLIRFCKYMEALVAYFKYLGGKDK
jgi:CRISPR-associated protein Csm2